MWAIVSFMLRKVFVLSALFKDDVSTTINMSETCMNIFASQTNNQSVDSNVNKVSVNFSFRGRYNDITGEVTNVNSSHNIASRLVSSVSSLLFDVHPLIPLSTCSLQHSCQVVAVAPVHCLSAQNNDLRPPVCETAGQNYRQTPKSMGFGSSRGPLCQLLQQSPILTSWLE